jgi:hypothetical protein
MTGGEKRKDGKNESRRAEKVEIKKGGNRRRERRKDGKKKG